MDSPAVVASYSRETIMDTAELAAALKCSVETVERSDLPMFALGEGKRLWRFHWGAVCDELARRSRKLARAS